MKQLAECALTSSQALQDVLTVRTLHTGISMNAAVLLTLGSAAMHQIENCNPVQNAQIMPIAAGIVHSFMIVVLAVKGQRAKGKV